MRKTDISKYTDKIDVQPRKRSPIKAFFSGIWRIIATVLLIGAIAGLIVGISVGIFIFNIANEPTGIDLTARSLNQSSFIYVKDPATGDFGKDPYQTLYGTENRIWVNLYDKDKTYEEDEKYIPQAMVDAIVAIEDKRFFEHNGVDWKRTGSAVLALVSGSSNYGGSTLTQQLVKNLTDDSEVSLTRKLREIFRAINIEKEYSKDKIIEAYLNVVNFGNNCQGVEAASELYFDKPINQCTVCECAAIAGITQNPSQWNPLIYPENNEYRRRTVLREMRDQDFITEEEFQEALKESDNLEFVGFSDDNEDEDEESSSNVQNWYINQMYYDLCRDLAKYYDISESAASMKLYTEGLKIYCAMDTEAQEMIEQEALKFNNNYDYDLQIGMTMVDYDGRVIATVGSSQEKEGPLDWDRASQSVLQPGSSIKAIIPYPMAVDRGIYNYSSVVTDQPIEKWKSDGYGGWVAGPPNAYEGYFNYVTMPEALSWSSNAAAVQTMELVGTKDAFNQAITNLGFEHLAESDADMVGSLSLGGMEGGVTVREMAAAMEYIGNGGNYYKPYTYYYITDQNNNIIIDNRNNTPIEAYTPETAYNMNRVLRYNVQTSTHTNSSYADIDGWEIVGKTGTTDYDRDAWFVGASPYCAMACWVGYDQPDTVPYTALATVTWQKVMANYLKGKEYKEFDVPDTIIPATYCKGSGMLASSFCTETGIGYYTASDMPDYCDGNHIAVMKPGESNTEAATEDATADPDATDSPGASGDSDETTGPNSSSSLASSQASSSASGESGADDGASSAPDDGGESVAPDGGESVAPDGGESVAPDGGEGA
ncbi:MAG: transglycosylase domain-containing protein [Ruminococcus sp.]|nr:transglycosylase domain-containing protein [Ruminococcus sp.]